MIEALCGTESQPTHYRNMKPQASTATFADNRTAPRIRRIAAIVNKASGSVGPDAARELQSIVAKFGVDVHLASVEPEGIESALRTAVSAGRSDLIVTLAGDGTARLAAELCGPDGPMLAPLPGGTMNLLPTALYGTSNWREALTSALTDGVVRSVPGGAVDGRTFCVAAILGSPALWSPAREAFRKWKMQLALHNARRAIGRAFTGKVRIEMDEGQHMKAEALALLSPLICGEEAASALQAIGLDPQNGGDALRIGMKALVGNWRADSAVRTQPCHRGRAFSRRSIPCILDGEMHTRGRSAEIAFVPVAFQALAPRRAPGSLHPTQNRDAKSL
jgi:diacylglycerol kinase family enzyme